MYVNISHFMERFPHSHCKTKKKMMHVIILCLKYDACNFGVIAAIVGFRKETKRILRFYLESTISPISATCFQVVSFCLVRILLNLTGNHPWVSSAYIYIYIYIYAHGRQDLSLASYSFSILLCSGN